MQKHVESKRLAKVPSLLIQRALKEGKISEPRLKFEYGKNNVKYVSGVSYKENGAYYEMVEDDIDLALKEAKKSAALLKIANIKPTICFTSYLKRAQNTLEILLELDWVRHAGRKDVPGKPIQYATTENFLNHFNIQKLSDLPTVDELSSAGLIDTSSIDKSIFGTGKFFKEQSVNDKQNIYEEIEDAIDKAPESDK